MTPRRSVGIEREMTLLKREGRRASELHKWRTEQLKSAEEQKDD